MKCPSVQTALSKSPIPAPGKGNPAFQAQDGVMLITGFLPIPQPQSAWGLDLSQVLKNKMKSELK